MTLRAEILISRVNDLYEKIDPHVPVDNGSAYMGAVLCNGCGAHVEVTSDSVEKLVEALIEATRGWTLTEEAEDYCHRCTTGLHAPV